MRERRRKKGILCAWIFYLNDDRARQSASGGEQRGADSFMNEEKRRRRAKRVGFNGRPRCWGFDPSIGSKKKKKKEKGIALAAADRYIVLLIQFNSSPLLVRRHRHLLAGRRRIEETVPENLIEGTTYQYT